MDALVYASIKNTISDNQISDIAKRNNDETNIEQLKKDFNDTLYQTTIKRACCLGVENIPVRIPDGVSYKDKIVNVPKRLCPMEYNLNILPNKCDKFYNIYCENVFDDYKENPSRDWAQFKPECACYGKVNKLLQDMNVPSRCYMKNCSEVNKAYIDPSSVGQICNKDVCDNIYKLTDEQLGENLSFIKETCGIRPVIEQPTPYEPISRHPEGPNIGQPEESAPGHPEGPNVGQPEGPNVGPPEGPSQGQPEEPNMGYPEEPTQGQPEEPNSGKPYETPLQEQPYEEAETIPEMKPEELAGNKSSSETWLIIIMVIFLVLALLFIGFLIYWYFKSRANNI